jgi:hypothetical protein
MRFGCLTVLSNPEFRLLTDPGVVSFKPRQRDMKQRLIGEDI